VFCTSIDGFHTWDYGIYPYHSTKNIKIHEVGENSSCCWLHIDLPTRLS